MDLPTLLIVVTLLGAYITIVNQKRFKRVKQLRESLGFSNDPLSYQDMTVEQAQLIEGHLAEWEFPWLFEFGWLFSFFRVGLHLSTVTSLLLPSTLILIIVMLTLGDVQPASAPALSIISTSTGHFVNKDIRIVHKRQQDTIVLMAAFMALPLKSEYNSLAIARINEHHANFKKINSDTVLYLIWIFWSGPVQWINIAGWRKLEPFEVHAMWVFWREIAVRFGVKYVPKTILEMEEWVAVFRREHVYYHKANRVLADVNMDLFLYMVPWFLRPMVRNCVYALVDEEIIQAVGWKNSVKLPRWLMRPFALGPLYLYAFLQRWFFLPRTQKYVRSTSGPNEKGLFNFPEPTYRTTPYYVKPNFWNRWGPEAIIFRLRGIAVPDQKWLGDGVQFEDIGPRRGLPSAQLTAESNVRKRARELMDADWGWRASVPFQSQPLVKPLSNGYGDSGAEGYPDGVKILTREADLRSRTLSAF
ncbi:MAG: hypothetical protein M1825_006112 [Sarcosagium campestre]|nr:MAG: hypothetical protein M1825_006112 [Sarcosagium campestre]